MAITNSKFTLSQINNNIESIVRSVSTGWIVDQCTVQDLVDIDANLTRQDALTDRQKSMMNVITVAINAHFPGFGQFLIAPKIVLAMLIVKKSNFDASVDVDEGHDTETDMSDGEDQ